MRQNNAFRIGLSAIRLPCLSLRIIVLVNSGTLLLLLLYTRFGDERCGLLHFINTPVRCIALFNIDNGSNFVVVARIDE